jgi:methionyl aminopeptidase
MGIALRNVAEIQKLANANRIVAQVLATVSQAVKVGITTRELDAIAEESVKKLGATASFKGLYGFPSSICTSVNNVIIHGIPDDKPLVDGDIVGLDFGSCCEGWYGDSAVTIGVGKVSDEDTKLMACAKDALEFAIEMVKDGRRFKELSWEVEKFILSQGYVPLRSYCGHGIGTKPHEEPSIPNYLEGKPNQGPKIKNGMVFCLEPMICQKDGESEVLGDGWSVVSVDRLRGSHFEHTVAVVNGRAQILSTL